ncbi:MAG TPA: tetratricopeptide repeat protein [Polyangiaceae bacterium]
MRGLARHAWGSALVVASAIAASSPARAQGPDAKAAAQVLFEQGRALVEQGHYAEACPKFAESLKLDSGIGTMLWLADCYESNGQTASAWAFFKEAAAAAALAHDGREKVARQRIAKLDGKLTTVAVLVPREAAVSGLEIRRDGIAVTADQWGIGVPADPGVHTIEATAPDRKPWSSNVELAAKPGLVSVTVPVLEPVAPTETPASASATGAPAEASAAPSAAEGRPGSRQRTIGLVVAGAGVVSLGVGAYFGLAAKSSYDASNADGHCVSNQCDGPGLSDRSSASTQAIAATVLFGVGLAAVAGGAVLYFTAPRGHAVTSLALSPMSANGGGGLSLSARW